MAKRSVLNVVVKPEGCVDGAAVNLLAPLIISAHVATYESLKYDCLCGAGGLFFWDGYDE